MYFYCPFFPTLHSFIYILFSIDQRVHTQLHKISHDRSYITTSSMSEIYEQSLLSQNIRNVILHQSRTHHLQLPRTELTSSAINATIAPRYNYRGPVCDFSSENRVNITSRCDNGRFADRMMMEGIKLRTTVHGSKRYLSSSSRTTSGATLTSRPANSSRSRRRTTVYNTTADTSSLASIRYIAPRSDGYPQYIDTIKPVGKETDSEEALIEELINKRKFLRYTDYLQQQQYHQQLQYLGGTISSS